MPLSLTHPPRITREVLGWTLVALGVLLGLWFSIHASSGIGTERLARERQVNNYFVIQCNQSALRDSITKKVLNNAITETNLNPVWDPAYKAARVERFQKAITDLEQLDDNCVKLIPPLPRAAG